MRGTVQQGLKITALLTAHAGRLGDIGLSAQTGIDPQPGVTVTGAQMSQEARGYQRISPAESDRCLRTSKHQALEIPSTVSEMPRRRDTTVVLRFNVDWRREEGGRGVVDDMVVG